MKKTIICTVLLALTLSSFSQKANSKQPLTSQEYLLKSKEQKETAWILVGLGTAAIGTGILIVSHRNFDLFEDDLTGVGIALGGGALLYLSSIPVFISSGKNKRRGMEALTYIKIEAVPSVHRNSPVHIVIPAVAVKVRF